jgi:hypothetical protein
MPTINKKFISRTIAGAAILATAPVLGKDTGGGCTGGQGLSTGCKDQPGVNHLILEELPGANSRICADTADAGTKTGTSMLPNNLTVAVDPFRDAYIQLTFSVSDIVANRQDKVLFLVYSPQTSPTPQIPTPSSKNKLQLDMSALEILAVYNVPALPLLPQMSTRVGAANPAPTSKVSFKVNLDTATLPVMMRGGENIIYLQAALLNKDKYDIGDYSAMIMSEMDTITFAEECPPDSSYCDVDDSGTLTTVLSDDTGGGFTKTADTSSVSLSTTTKTKGDLPPCTTCSM